MTATNPLGQVIEILNASGFVEAAGYFAREVAKLESTDTEERKSAVQAILNMCQPRGLGDLNVAKLSLLEWYEILDRAGRFAQNLL